jgi:hypothetical protein
MSSDAPSDKPIKDQLDLFAPAAEDVATPKLKTKTPKKRASKKPEGLSDLYSKKDWSPLTKTVTTEIAVAKKTTVTIPVVKAAEIPYEPDESQKESSVMSVSDLNKHIREILEGRFPLLWLKAEISNFKAHTSGHFYFSLKDAKAQISAVMFRGFNSSLRFRPEDGMEVLVRGKITVYEPRGNYQIFCEMMEPVGAGALQKAF